MWTILACLESNKIASDKPPISVYTINYDINDDNNNNIYIYCNTLDNLKLPTIQYNTAMVLLYEDFKLNHIVKSTDNEENERYFNNSSMILNNGIKVLDDSRFKIPTLRDNDEVYKLENLIHYKLTKYIKVKLKS